MNSFNAGAELLDVLKLASTVAWYGFYRRGHPCRTNWDKAPENLRKTRKSTGKRDFGRTSKRTDWKWTERRFWHGTAKELACNSYQPSSFPSPRSQPIWWDHGPWILSDMDKLAFNWTLTSPIAQWIAAYNNYKFCWKISETSPGYATESNSNTVCNKVSTTTYTSSTEDNAFLI